MSEHEREPLSSVEEEGIVDQQAAILEQEEQEEGEGGRPETGDPDAPANAVVDTEDESPPEPGEPA